MSTERELLQRALSICADCGAAELARDIKAELANPEPSSDPIAWTTGICWNPRQSEIVEKLTRHAQPEHGFNIPLYTHLPEREPLTDDEVKAGIKEYGNKLLFSQRQFFKWGVRFAERKHNIGTTAQPAQSEE